MNKLYVVGIGPGDAQGLTGHARAALEEAQLLCGYTKYIQLVAPLYPDKPVLSTGMRQEEARCHAALQAAAEGKTVALVCSGDAGVYGMAGLVYQLSDGYPAVEIQVVPGVTAALAGSALLGAPLGHDFAVVSLSDLLTPWPVIEARLDAAARADFVLCLYNPASKGRRDHLQQACGILLRHKDPGTVCGWTRDIGRTQEDWGLLTLAELRDYEADMFTTVFVGNGETQALAGRMVTPRGYGLTI